MGKQSGYIVETSQGLGITYHGEKFQQGKVVVHLVEEDLTPKKDEKGNPKKLLVSVEKIKQIGFHD